MLVAIAAVTIGLPLGTLAAQRRLARPAAMPHSLAAWSRLRLQHAAMDRTAIVLALLSSALIAVGLAVLLSWLGTSYQAALPAGNFQRIPRLTWISFLAPSVVLGILTGVLATDLALRWALGDRYGEYELAFGGGSHGRRGDRGMLPLTLVVAVLVTGFVTLNVDFYSRFEEDRIVVNPFWGIGEQSYNYRDVEAVIRTSHVRKRTREIAQTRYFILFTDGRQWCNEDYGRPSGDALDEDAALAAFVCRKSGKTLTVLRLIEDARGR
jgi:hypothetical protein